MKTNLKVDEKTLILKSMFIMLSDDFHINDEKIHFLNEVAGMSTEFQLIEFKKQIENWKNEYISQPEYLLKNFLDELNKANIDTLTKQLLLSFESTNPDDDYGSVILITHDETQKTIETRSVESFKKRVNWYKKVFDKKDQLQRKYVFNEFGQTTSIIVYKPNNEKGATPSFIRFSEYKDLIKDDIFQYDEKGNWISQLVTLNGEPYNYHERTIEYFHLTLFD